jgi:hypothetical protein
MWNAGGVNGQAGSSETPIIADFQTLVTLFNSLSVYCIPRDLVDMLGCAGTGHHAFTYCSAELLAVACLSCIVEGV